MPKKRCRYCHTTENLTYDHKQPVIKGGTDEHKNMQVLCYPCNVVKGDIPHKRLMHIIRWYEGTKLTRKKAWRHQYKNKK